MYNAPLTLFGVYKVLFDAVQREDEDGGGNLGTARLGKIKINVFSVPADLKRNHKRCHAPRYQPPEFGSWSSSWRSSMRSSPASPGTNRRPRTVEPIGGRGGEMSQSVLSHPEKCKPHWLWYSEVQNILSRYQRVSLLYTALLPPSLVSNRRGLQGLAST